MYGPYGRFQLADTWGAGQKGKLIVCINDPSTHGGILLTHNQIDGKLSCRGFAEKVGVENGLHLCSIYAHGITPVTAVTTKSFHNGRLILTEMAFAGCGARMAPPYRKTYVE
jgi:hypothetical protein